MKKRLKQAKWLALALTAVALGSGSATATAAAAGGEAKEATETSFGLWAGGKPVSADKPPVVIDGSTYVPLRTLAELLGKQVEWNEWEQAIRLKAKPTVEATHDWNDPKELGGGIREGGFSGLVRLPNDPADVFYTLADRGPNGEYGKDKLRTFPVESFVPRLYKIKASGGSIEVLETIPLKLPAGKTDRFTGTTAISGLPNTEGTDEVPYDGTGTKKLAYDPDGLDLEGIAYSPSDDTFWLSDEYRPSLIQVKRDGTILGRYIPQGAKDALVAAGAQSELYDVLPAAYAKRIPNRGFEGVAISPDGAYLYASIQSPLANPDKKTGEASRSLRILKLDLKTKQPVGEYVYIAEDASMFENVKQKDVVISDLSGLGTDVLLVDERDKNAGSEAQIKRLYRVDLTKATNVLGQLFGGKELEALTPAELRERGVVPAAKELVADVAKLGYPHEKLEGIAPIDRNRIAIVNDNDFGVDGYGDDGKLKVNAAAKTQLFVVKVEEPLY
ncbi:esterase-like activity of phytase family protein [Paenibacillus flagellatus]|uniref:Copper amine oxidase n=1 Tax=Paenibacillus flagellatus TaxID=2211139 RepID=A0A2V5JW08_9BACL|nr:esterase-like activity of phytase family protein [Paenibacillus flagellatus]PYI50721.1 copper amine oxidase [Paenibacillus flagellatus]